MKVNQQPDVNAMDLYLPADFYDLRHALNDWRDHGSSDHAPEPPPATQARDPREDSADPMWRAI